jgi:hypothetical protein
MRLMVRVLAVLAVLGLFTTVQAHAQNPTIGFKLGPSFSKFALDEPDDELKWLTKFTGGGFIRYDMAAFALQPELMYNTKGARGTEEGVTVEFRLDYIEVPVLFVLPLGRGAGVRPQLYAGPAFAIEVGCSIGLSGGGFDASVDCDAGDEDLSRKKFDIGAMVGGGLAIPMGPGALLIEGRYNHGLMNLADDSDGTLRHRNIVALVGYSIPIGAR